MRSQAQTGRRRPENQGSPSAPLLFCVCPCWLSMEPDTSIALGYARWCVQAEPPAQRFNYRGSAPLTAKAVGASRSRFAQLSVQHPPPAKPRNLPDHRFANYRVQHPSTGKAVEPPRSKARSAGCPQSCFFMPMSFMGNMVVDKQKRNTDMMTRAERPSWDFGSRCPTCAKSVDFPMLWPYFP
jgi:hypothetical protein